MNLLNLLRPPFRRWLLACVVLALSACGGRTDGFYPLAKGWSWAYSVDIKTTKSSARKFRYVVENIGQGKLDGHDVYIQRAANGARRYYREDKSGVLWVGETMPDEAAVVFSPPKIVLPSPPDKSAPPWTNTEYTTALEGFGPPKGPLHIDISEKLNVRYVVESVDDEVVVPAGRFLHCLRIRGDGETQADIVKPVGRITIHAISTQWFAPGIGLVKAQRQETTSGSTIPGGEWQMELIEVHRP